MTKILVIGELGLDVFVYGNVTRICPEAPVPVFNPKYEKENPGMAGNVVENLKSLDSNSDIIHWHQSEKITKKRIVEEKSNQMLLRLDEGELGVISPLIFLSPRNQTTISESDLIIISDYDKGYLLPEMIKKISELHPLVILDTKKKLSWDTVKNVKYVKLNETEYLNNKELVDQYPEKFIVTLGSKGCMYNGVVYPSPKPQKTYDVSGAGDTFVASFAHKLIESENVEESINFANEMASIVVSQIGVTTPKNIN
jgi:bifunctional ADP-heptose synthase (sugar kinase/adenylyltransferase)